MTAVQALALILGLDPASEWDMEPWFAIRHQIGQEMYAHAGLPEVSDEATLLHQQGRRVMTVAGEATNIHVTTPYELALAVAAARSAGDGDDSD